MRLSPDEPPLEAPRPLFELIRQRMQDELEGLSDDDLRILALGAAEKVAAAEEAHTQKYYREPFFYAVNVGLFGTDGAAIASGVTSPSGKNKYRIEPTSNFEAYFAMRYSRDEVLGGINNDRSFRSRVFYSGSRGVTSKDESAPSPAADQLRNQNAWGSNVRPARYVWPRVFPAGGVGRVRDYKR